MKWGEWLQTFSHDIDALKAIVVTLGGVATAALGWLGISLSRRTRAVVPKPKPKPKAKPKVASQQRDA
jgi:hypothetical protein